MLLLLIVTKVGLAKNSFDRQGEFNNRKLMIVLYEEQSSILEELEGNEEALNKYKESIKTYNKNIQEVFKNNWSNKEQEFMFQSKIETLSNEELITSAILTTQIKSIEKVKFFVFTINMVYAIEGKKGTKHLCDTREFNVNLQDVIPSKSDLFYLVTKIKMYFDVEKVFDRSNLTSLLTSKTLLIDEGYTDLKSSEISEFYKFPFKISTSEEISKLANTTDKNSLYLKLDIDSKSMINFIMIECETGRIIARCSLSGVNKVSFNSPSNNHMKLQSFYNPKTASPNPYIGNGMGLIGKEILRLYTKQAKLKKLELIFISTEKKQVKYFSPLMIY